MTSETSSRNAAKMFTPGMRQHEQLSIPTEGLPQVAEAEFDRLLNCLWRYEEALGLGGPGEGDAEKDAALLAQVISDSEGIPLREAHSIVERTAEKHRSGRALDAAESSTTVIWQPQHALEFVARLSGTLRSTVAAFLYLHQCDELAEGLFEPDDREAWIQQTYAWALEHK